MFSLVQLDDLGDFARITAGLSSKETFMAIRLQRDGIKVHSGHSMSQGRAVGQKDRKQMYKCDYSKPPSRRNVRLNKEREELTIFLEEVKGCINCGGRAWFKHEVMTLWCEGEGQNERQFRRRLSELSEHHRAFYERLPDRRFRTFQMAD